MSTTAETEFYDTLLDVDLKAEQQKIDAILKKAQAANRIKLKNAINRNIIFLGRTRTGKSTALKVLKDAIHIASPVSMFSDTVNPNLYSFTVESSLLPAKPPTTITPSSPGQNQTPVPTEINYNINIIDTPGLFEVKSKDANVDLRDNEVIKKMILKCMEYEITKIHAIFFVCSFSLGVNKEDLQAFAEFLKLFRGAEGTISMLITHGERFSEDRKVQICKEILKHSELSEFAKTIENKIFFTGAVSEQDYENGLTQSIQVDCVNVMKMRALLYLHVFSSEKHCQLTNIDYFVEQQHLVEQLQEDLLKLQENLKTQTMELETKQNLEKQHQILLTQLEKLRGFINNRLGTDRYKEICDNKKIIEQQSIMT